MKEINKAKKSIKVDDEMKQPLLLESALEESKHDSFTMKSPTSNRRITPRDLAATLGKGKTPKNPLKQQVFDKFNCGMKGQLLAQQKEEQERYKREVEDNRKRDLEEFK